MKYMEENEAVRRLSKITKTWMAHVEKGPLSGSVDLPPQADASTQNEKKNAMKQAFPTREAGAGGFLRVYEQNIPDKLLSTQMSEPEVKSMDAQSTEFSDTLDVSAPLRASLALAADHAYVSQIVADAIQKEKVKKQFEIDRDTMQVFYEEGKGTSIAVSVHDKANPSKTEVIVASIDETKLSSKEVLENLQKQANEVAQEQHTKTSYISKGLAIHGVLTGFGGALSQLEEGDIAEGSITLAQSVQGLGDLTGINQKIWQTSKQFLKEALQEPMEKLGESAVAGEGEKLFQMKISSIVGKVDLAVLDDIPIVGTVFGIYSIAEDFMNHNTLGYIDAGLDILTTGISLLGPEAEPFVIALSIIRMGID